MWVRSSASGGTSSRARCPRARRFASTGPSQRRYGDSRRRAFEFEPADAPPRKFGRILPIYPLAAAESGGPAKGDRAAAVKRYGRNVEATRFPTRAAPRRGLLPTAEALEAVHLPRHGRARRAGRRTLVYLELFFLQLAIGRRAAQRAQSDTTGATLPSGPRAPLLESLPFSHRRSAHRPRGDHRTNSSGDPDGAAAAGRRRQSGRRSWRCLRAPLIERDTRSRSWRRPSSSPASTPTRRAALADAGLDVSVGLLSGTVAPSARRPLLEAVATGAVDLVVGHARGVHRRGDLSQSAVHHHRRTAPFRRPATRGAHAEGPRDPTCSS